MSATPPLTPTPPLPPRRAAQMATATFLVLLVAGLAYRGYGARFGVRPTDAVAATADLRVDLNRADPLELEQVPGVGPKLAKAIDDHRREKGPFGSVEELRSVRGVGPKTLDQMRPFLYTAPHPSAPPPDAEPLVLARKPVAAPPEVAPRPAYATVRKVQPGEPPVDVNAATTDELQQLPGVGPVLAGRIAEARGRERFKTVDDLRRVKGIGPKTLEAIRPVAVAK